MLRIICVDSFKMEYLKHAPYLSSLTKKYQHGSLETPLGFWGAEEVLFKGESDTLAFFYKDKNSSLKWTKYFWFLGRLPIELVINFSRFVKGEQLFLTHKIPLRNLHYFEAVKKHPSKSFKCHYIHILDIDKTAHKYGTTSKEIIKSIKKVDKKLRKMDFDIIFSDHGMIDVKEIIRVPETKICFIDSTMARYWGDKPRNLPLRKGKLIKGNKKFGETIFLTNPGVLILPNYWQGRKMVRAMHGYNPKHKDMKGFYIIKKEDGRKDLKMIDLYKFISQYIEK